MSELLRRFEEAIHKLNGDELRSLKRFAQWRMRGLGRRAAGKDWEDLLGEALTATVGGSRNWDSRVDLHTHLLGAMRSISTAWGEIRGTGETYLESELLKAGDERSPLEQVSTSPDPSEHFEVKESLIGIKRQFERDQHALDVIHLLAMEYSGREIQTQLGITELQFRATMKRIRRGVSVLVNRRRICAETNR